MNESDGINVLLLNVKLFRYTNAFYKPAERFQVNAKKLRKVKHTSWANKLYELAFFQWWFWLLKLKNTYKTWKAFTIFKAFVLAQKKGARRLLNKYARSFNFKAGVGHFICVYLRICSNSSASTQLCICLSIVYFACVSVCITMIKLVRNFSLIDSDCDYVKYSHIKCLVIGRVKICGSKKRSNPV